MNWLTRTISKVFPRKKKSLDVAENSWVKCPQCQTMLYSSDLETTLFVCNNCDEHLQIHPRVRFKALFDDGKFEEIKYESNFSDPLNFKDVKTYKDRWYEAREKAGTDEVFLVGAGVINGISTCVACMNWSFLGGSVGQAGAEALVKAAEHCVTNNVPLLVIACSGGMRMQTSMLSLQTLPKTTIAIQMVKDSGLPVITLLTNPVSGGTMASFASLGHITIAEPNALICFAGPRVIKNTVGETLPEGFQRSEYLLKHGFLDSIVHRSDVKAKVSQIISLLLKRVA